MILSFDYIRLRRNRLIHDNGETSTNFKKLFKHKMQKLKDYWGNCIDEEDIQFKLEELNLFNVDELIFFFNVARRVCQYFDASIMEVMDENELYKYEFNTGFPNKKKYSTNIMVRKARKYLEDLLGKKPSAEIILKIINEEI